MATNFPTTLDSLTNPSAGNTLNSPSHSTQHANSNDAIEALQAKVGVDSSAVTTSLDYKVRVGNPVGEIAMWSTNTAPTGWLLCDGTPANRSTYSALHSLMQAAGYPYGAGNGSTTFGIPYFPQDYTDVHSNSSIGTQTVGQNLSHTHPLTNVWARNFAGSVNISSVGGSADANNVSATGSSGGAANLAAGTRVLKCVKY